ncbi:C39 family peptidase [Olegusella massiliensis]|uniref:C39 family peptidase n=1 Tax=Olegusella massiliensis TaxID=1776381 RepID=UPI0023F9DBB1|nr:C39 family peptidase [Olegusella massiliensis]
MEAICEGSVSHNDVVYRGGVTRYSRSASTLRSYQRRAHRRHRHRGWFKRVIILFFLTLTFLGAICFQQGLLPWQRPSKTTPAELVSLFERNPEARQFVLDYDKHHNDHPTIDLSEYAHSSMVPLFLQWDERWGYTNYAGQFFALSGCGPSCLSMAYIYLTGDTSMSPLAMGEFATAQGYAVDGEGSAWALMSQGARKLGLDVTEIPLQEARVKANLEAGNPIICIMGQGDFTKTGHFIVLAGLKEDGIVVRDPNSKERSNKIWTYDELEGQIQNLWVLRKSQV